MANELQIRDELLARVNALEKREQSEANDQRLLEYRSMIGELCLNTGRTPTTHEQLRSSDPTP